MPIQIPRVRVTLDQNPNLKVTTRTREHLGVSAVGSDEVQARLLGIPGPEGPPGIVWRGEWSGTATYQDGDAVGYFGSSYLYVNPVPSTGQPVEDNTNYWYVLAYRGEDGTSGSGTDQSAQIMSEPTGFPNRTESRMYLDNATRRFYIEPTGASWSFWIAGVEYTHGTPDYVELPDLESIFFIYYDSDDVLKYSQTFPDTLQGLVMVSMVYWDVDIQEFTYFGEERHGLVMDWATHQYLHETMGCQFAHGLDLFFTSGGDGSTEEELQIGLSNGVVFDEDLRHSIEHADPATEFFQQKLDPVAFVPVIYRTGIDGEWNKIDATNVPLNFGSGSCTWNYWDGGEWFLSDVPNNNYFTMWVFVTNDVIHPIVSFMGQYVNGNLEKCLEGSKYGDLRLENIPTPEFKLLYRLTYFSKSNLANSYNAKLIRVDDFRADADKAVSKADPSSHSDKHFTYEQSVSSAIWTVNHGLNKIPSFYVVDTGGTVVEGDLNIVDINTIELTFSAPFTGTVYFN